MKKILAVMAMTLILGVTAKVFAADQPAYKFGYVDFQRALNEVEEGKKAKAMLKSEFDEKQKNLDAVQNQLQTMRSDLDKQRLILSADALKEKEEEYRKKFIELQQKLASYKEELGMKEAKLTGDILAVIHKIVSDIGSKDSYSLILEKSQDVVLYSPSNADLTEQVIKAYNAMPKGQKDSIIKSFGPVSPAPQKGKK